MFEQQICARAFRASSFSNKARKSSKLDISTRFNFLSCLEKWCKTAVHDRLMKMKHRVYPYERIIMVVFKCKGDTCDGIYVGSLVVIVIDAACANRAFESWLGSRWWWRRRLRRCLRHWRGRRVYWQQCGG